MQNAPTQSTLQDEETVVLDLDALPHGNPADAPETLFDKLKRCGNPRGSTPLPWPQLSIVALVSLSEGTPRPNFASLTFALSALQSNSAGLYSLECYSNHCLLQVLRPPSCFPSWRS